MLRWSVFTSERRRLKVTLLVLLFVQALMFEAWQPPLASASTISPYPDWLCNARIASLYFEPDIVSLDDLRLEVDNLASQGVSVVELDSGLSYYDWFGIDDRFQRNLDMIGQIASYIHAKQLKVVVYVAALEMILKDGEHNTPSSRTIQTGFRSASKASLWLIMASLKSRSHG